MSRSESDPKGELRWQNIFSLTFGSLIPRFAVLSHCLTCKAKVAAL
jgi:hypothetical protein